MKKMQYVGARAQGITVRFPFPHVSKSSERGVVVFSGPGDVQEIENHQDAASLYQNGGGQFAYVDVPKEEKSAPAPDAASDVDSGENTGSVEEVVGKKKNRSR